MNVEVKVEDGPDELYLRGLATLELFLPNGRELSFRTGVERVRNSRFVSGATRHDGLVEVELRWPLFAVDRP